MRAVFDTNVLLSALLWSGPPHALLEHARNGTVSLVCSPALLEELAAVIARPKFNAILIASNTSREHMLFEMRQLAELFDPPALSHPVCRDPDDDAVLALALASQADMLISGDEDLLSLKSFQGIPILSPAKALLEIAKSQ